MRAITRIDDAIVERIKFVNEVDCRPASYADFKTLEVEEKPCIVKYSTLRNKISVLKREGIIERCYNSKASFFVMKGIKFGKHKIHDSEVKKLSQTINSLPENDRGLHNVHFKFIVPDIWKIISHSGRYKVIQESSDIVLPPLVLNGMRIRANVQWS